jgi:S-formylglutathione hydrolase FrmB
VTVLTPLSGQRSRRPLPVLFLLHGYGGGRRTWLTGTRLLDHLAGLDLIVVLPESGRRWFINDHRGHRYEDYLVDELVPFVDEHFATGGVPGCRAIGGFSMGGAAALMQALRHPGLFSVVASHAGAFDAPSRMGDPYAAFRSDPGFGIPSTTSHERVWGPPGSGVCRRYDIHAMIAAGTRHPGLSVYVDVGLGDYDRILAMNRGMAQKLASAGIRLEYHERSGGHDLDFLNRALPFSLRFVQETLERP